MGLALFAFGLVLITEGLVFALAPSLVENLLDALRGLPLTARRNIGLAALVCGGLLVWAAAGLGALG